MKKRIKRVGRSIGYARNGIYHALVTQPNMWVHIFLGTCAVFLGLLLNFDTTEWVLLVLIISQVLILEMVNTVAEIVVDIASPDFSDLARTAKDVGAGAVLIAALASVVGGSILFLPKIVELWL